LYTKHRFRIYILDSLIIYTLIKRFFNSDQNLIRRLRKGDKIAFELIYNKFKEKLYYFTLRYIHTAIDSEEIIQNVFVSLWENRDALKEGHSLSSYLYKITINQIYNHLKHRAVRQKYFEQISRMETQEADDSQQHIYHMDLQGVIGKLMESMPEKQQFIFRLSRQDGLSNNEIAQRLGLSVRSVENQIYRAVKFIKSKLRHEYHLTD